MKDKAMTAKSFLHKASAKVSPVVFLFTHKDWLTHNVPETIIVFNELDNGTIFPTSALETIKELVFQFQKNQDNQKHKLYEQKLSSNTQKTNSKPKETSKEEKPKVVKSGWIAIILDSKGNVVTKNGEDLSKSFELIQQADRYVDLRLVEAASDCFGVISHTTMVSSDNEAIEFTVLRQDAIARVFTPNKKPAMRDTSGKSGRLSFGIKVKDYVAKFSHG